MRAERDALLKLVQALRREYEAVQLAKEAQHDELRSLKDKMTVKVRASAVTAGRGAADSDRHSVITLVCPSLASFTVATSWMHALCLHTTEQVLGHLQSLHQQPRVPVT